MLFLHLTLFIIKKNKKYIPIAYVKIELFHELYLLYIFINSH